MIWCDRKRCIFRALNEGETLEYDLPEAYGDGYCRLSEIKIDNYGRCMDIQYRKILKGGE